MKILTPEEESAHNRATIEGGLIGGIAGLAAGSIGVYIASQRYHAFRQLSVPFRAFIITSSTTFAAVVSADRYSRKFEKSRHSDSDYQNESERAMATLQEQQSTGERVKGFLSEQRYPIVFGSWVASMGIALGLVGRNKYLTGQQKLVQARVYAQGLTLAVLIASFGLESNDMRAGKGRWETVKVLDPDDPEHKRIIEKKIHHEAYSGEDQWMDMIESQERKMKAKNERVRDRDEKHNGNSKTEKSDSKDSSKSSEKKEDGESEEKPQEKGGDSKKGGESTENGEGKKGDSKSGSEGRKSGDSKDSKKTDKKESK